MRFLLTAACACCFVLGLSAQERLSVTQIEEAIALGKNGKIPVHRVSRFLGDFDLFIDGPVARIAAAAVAATREYKPFDAAQVTSEMAEVLYRVRVEPKDDIRSRFLGVKNIVVQPRGAKGMDGVIQPLKLSYDYAIFDRFPDGEFQIVVVGRDGPQTYPVSLKDRAQIR
jgi:hypothetical protein